MKKENKYLVMKKKHQSDYNEFVTKYAFFAFSNEQFAKGMAKLNLKNGDESKLYSTGNGMYYLKERSKEIHDMMDAHDKELWDNIHADETGEGFCFDMFDYELSNHEYCITYDITSTLDALCLTLEDIEKYSQLDEALYLAKKNQIRNNY
jgi:hypothetical protein